MKSHGAIVQRLPSCATIGLVTTVCTGITNDLALHHSRMADLWIGFDSINDVLREVAGEVLQILQDGVCAYASCNGQENALCYWAHQELDIDISEFNTSCAVLDINKSPDLNKNSCGLVLKKHKEAGRAVHIHWNGEFEKMLSMCSHYCKVDGTMQTLDEDKKDLLNREFWQIASNCLQVLAFAYKEINQEEENGEIEEDDADDNEETLKPLEHGLIFLALVSLKNPYAPEMRQAIQDCRASGVTFKLVIDTDVTTARIMALYSGILRPEEDIEGAITEASDFRKKDQEERLKTIENIHVVALAGLCIRDCPSLIEADVGIFMGNLRGAEDADIVVLNQNVSLIFTIIKLGRCVHESVKKFMQLQLTLNITAFTVNFVFVIARRDVQLLPFQVLWINVIMDVLGALALAIRIVEVQGESGVQDAGDPIITSTMWRNVAVQSLIQITILSMTEEFFASRKCLLISLGIVGIIVVLEVGLVEIMATIAHWGKLNSKEWCFCIGIAALSVPIVCVAN
ncbi:calcium-transporting ATPase 12, plasma membrane-type-like [Olea europaea subsp. europaea]|uniref:Calcium-transporting ATPase 12, plasma membrane-type-like n=1 Tax=Olea europaea subsp. europaea TaxID=158383 RepID=A0A8S0RCC1_OLEEU|nr:calcium-transporting ATPase 12, plasma membrane-type-like [Olea europaea subsp. europaea]